MSFPTIPPRSTTTVLWVLLPIGISVGLYWPTLLDLGKLWASTQDYGHGYLIVPISLYLLWRRRAEIAGAPHVPQWYMAIVVALGSLGWLAAHLVGVQVVMQAAWLGMLIAALWGVLGWKRARWVIFPVAYMVFAIPIWAVLVPPLQLLTADVATWGVRAVGIPVFREGPFLTIPAGRFEIAEVCAGLRFLMAAMSLGALYAYLNFDKTLARVCFFSLSVVWAIFFNWVRVVVVIALGHIFGMEAAIVQDHNSVGWGLFAISLVPLFVIGHYMQAPHLREPPEPPEPQQLEESERPVTKSAGPQAQEPSRANYSLTVLSMLVAGALGPAAAAVFSGGPVAPAEHFTVKFPAEVAGWNRVLDGAPRWAPAYPGASIQQQAHYKAGGMRVSVFIARFASQSQGQEIINDENSLFDPDAWSVQAKFGSRWGEDNPVMGLRLQGRGGRRGVEFVYSVAGVPVNSSLRAKYLELKGKLQGRRDASVVALMWEGSKPPLGHDALGKFFLEAVR